MQLCNTSLHIQDNAEEYWITARGVTRLNCARGKKQVWRPCVRTWGRPEANVLHWSSCDIVRTFRRPAVIQRLHSDLAPGQLCPLPPVVTRAATRLNKSWYTALTRGIREPWALGGAKENFAGRWFCFRKLPKNIKKFFLNFFKSCPNLPPTFYAYSFNAETLAK